MLVIQCGNPNSSERDLAKALADLDGVLVMGYVAAQGNKEIEIDALLFTPVRAVAIEVKSPLLGTPRSGELVPSVNAPWQIDGETAEFYGGSNPLNQAKTAAQVFASFIRETLTRTPFIQVAVSVSDADLTMKDGPMMVGQTAVSLTSQIVESLDQMKKKPIDLEMVLSILDTMDLGLFAPKREAVKKEWDNFHANTEIEKNEEPVTQKKRKNRVVKTENLFISNIGDALNFFIFLFLVFWFLNSVGVFEALIDALNAVIETLGFSTPSTPEITGPPPGSEELMEELQQQSLDSNEK